MGEWVDEERVEGESRDRYERGWHAGGWNGDCIRRWVDHWLFRRESTANTHQWAKKPRQTLGWKGYVLHSLRRGWDEG